MSKENIPSYPEFESELKKTNAVTSPAWLHGCLSGYICAGGEPVSTKWEQVIALESSFSTELSAMLQKFARQIAAGLKNLEGELPAVFIEQHQLLETRIHELRSWCSGFLEGVATMIDESGLEDASKELEQALKDLHMVTELSPEVDDNIEVEEQFQFVVEHVRALALMVHIEIMASNKPVLMETTLH